MSRLEAIADAFDLLGSAYRGDWGDFDGRTLRHQLNELTHYLRNEEPFDLDAWAYSSDICVVERCWSEHCREPSTSSYSCGHREAYEAKL